MIILVGKTGSGKSYTGLSIGKIVDPNFNASRIAFKSEDFMNLINKGLPAGSVIMWDESGVGMSNRNWFTQANKIIIYVTQTFRHRNLVCIFTVPSFGFIDSHLRQLFDLCLVTTGINKRDKKCIVKPLFLQNNPELGKLYKKYKYKDGEKITRIRVGMPDLLLRRQYETRKLEFTDSLNANAQTSLKELDPSLTKNELTARQKQIYELYTGGKDARGISEELRISAQTVWATLVRIRGKGYAC